MLLPILVLIICWTLNPFVKKKIMNLPDKSNANIRPVDFLLVSNLIAVTVVLLVYLYNSRDKLSVVGTIKSLTPKQWAYFAANAASHTYCHIFVCICFRKGKDNKTYTFNTISSHFVFIFNRVICVKRGCSAI